MENIKPLHCVTNLNFPVIYEIIDDPRMTIATEHDPLFSQGARRAVWKNTVNDSSILFAVIRL